MQDFVSTRGVGVFAPVAWLSAAWVACSIFIPYGFPWMGLAGLGLALWAAHWVSNGSIRSIGQVLHDVEAEPVPAVAAK